MGKKMGLGDRMKTYYEDRTKVFLNRKTITIIRLDGNGFSKLTKNLDKPFDDGFSQDMDATALFLCEKLQGAKFAYTQSDEISIVLTDFDSQDTDAWYDYNVQKMTSIAASMATARFNQLRVLRMLNEADTPNSSYLIDNDYKLAFFDARVFQVPNVDEMFNAILWRQQDCTRNSISMAASANFPHKQIEGKSGSDKQEMLFKEKGINWNNYAIKYKRGIIIKKESVYVDGPNGGGLRNIWLPDYETPILTENKEYIYNLIPIL